MLTTNVILICLSVLFKLLYFVNGNTLKGSVTFVIDETISMLEEINQVKTTTHVLFNEILQANTTRVEEFILVTFNDPAADIRAATTDPNEFRQALDKIELRGNYDCPEYAMAGIELALEKSKPNSFLYVYTDASAKDYKEFERIKSLSIKKSTQVNFLLTGQCTSSYDEDYLVYDKLAEATGGEIFHIGKQQINEIGKYIIESFKGVKTIIAQKILKDHSEKQLQFNVDSKEWDVIVSVSSHNPKFNVIGPDGNKVHTTNIVLTENVLIEKLTTKPGTYTIHFESTPINSSVTITATTDVTFKHGFSIIEPESLNETATKPILGEKTYLAVYLENDKKDVKLKTVQLIIDNNTSVELPLKLINKDQQFYVTESFVPPTKRFKLAVVGHTNSNEKITRLGSTVIEAQNTGVNGINTLPSVSILGGPKINADYDQPLEVKCKLHAYPKPNVVCEDSFGGVWPSSIVPLDLPYEYMSTLNLDKVNKNLTITCKAINDVGTGVSTVNIETNRKTFLNILEFPKDVTIPYGDIVDFQFIVDAYPSVTITWYKDSKLIDVNEEFEISPNISILSIKHMNDHHIGNYSVKASNGYHYENITFKVSIREEIPHINKSETTYKFKNGLEAIMNCRLTQGYPLPEIIWFFNNGSSRATELHETGQSIRITNVTDESSGTYTCVASNKIGNDSHVLDLIVEYPPSIDQKDEIKNVEQGKQVTLDCYFKGQPAPSVKWFQNNIEIRRSAKYWFYRENELLYFTVNSDSSGNFTCKATNPLGEATRNITVNVYTSVRIDPPEETNLTINVGSDLKLNCSAHGIPKPMLNWTFYSFDRDTQRTLSEDENTQSIKVSRIQIADEGRYVCMANNIGGSAFLTYDVHVTAPPTIDNALIDETLTGVKGDLVLRIPCTAVGIPKPVITWMLGDDYVAIDSDWYDVDTNGTLIIKDINIDSAGNYKCIANNSVGYDFKEFNVEVRAYPEPDNVYTEIQLLEGSSTDIKCNLSHEKEDLVRWYKEGRLIHTGELHLSKVTTSDSGIYTCRVSNFLGSNSSHTKINISPQECMLNIETDLNDQQPFMLTSEREWKTFDFKNETFIRIPNQHKVLLLCPESSTISRESLFSNGVNAICIDKTTFMIEEEQVDFKELKCSNKNRPLGKIIGANCDPASNNTELITVGFNMRSKFLRVYDVCIDKDKKVPIFAKIILHKSFTNKIPKALTAVDFTGSTRLPYDYGNCFTPRTIKPVMCHNKRQLINPQDISPLPGLPQVAAYDYLNVVPQLKSIGSENWDEIERRVRQLAQELDQNLVVWTGGSQPLNLPAIPEKANANLIDLFHRMQPIAPFIWKVIQNPEGDEALAIIQINIPYLTITKAVTYIPCRDVCDKVKWMTHSEWYNVDKGFIFCCSMEDFTSVFGFKGQFKDAKNILAPHLVLKPDLK